MAKFFNFEQEYFGLTDEEVAAQEELYGLNIYSKDVKPHDKFSYADVILSPAAVVLFIGAVLCFVTARIGEGIAALLIDVLYCFCDIYFREKADKRLSELRESTAMKFRVIRNGSLQLIDKKYIVSDDTLVVQEGERIPADAVILESRGLTCDESIFSGDNKPVAKTVKTAFAKDNSMIYSGTTVLTGIAVCKVSATGIDTKLYKHIGESAERHPYSTGFEKFAKIIVLACSGAALLLMIISLIVRLTGGSDVCEAALSAVSLGLCFLPAGVSSVIRYYYIKGADELLKKGAVVKSLNEIEKLNSLSALCIEKEGAISKNSVEVRGIYARSEELLYKVAALACGQNTTDPAERALMVKATFFDEKISDVFTDNKFIEKLAERNDAISGALWEVGGDRIYCIKGNPEQILPMCRLSGDALLAAQKRYREYYDNGSRVIAFACVEADARELDRTSGFSYIFVGFAAFSAPLRDYVSAAVKTCRSAGVRVVMFTEETPAVAVSTGKMIGISSDKVITGEEIAESRISGSSLDLSSDIYAGITPEQKPYIIDKFRENGEIVAMAGIRPEDGAALDEADIGITISAHSSGNTYEAADIVMNDDNFNSIAQTIYCARQIHRNIKRAVSLLISGYVGIVVMLLMGLIISGGVIVNPPITALLTMIILPMLAIGYEGVNADIKHGMPPSDFVARGKPNFRFLGGAAVTGFVSGAFAVLSYALNSASPENGITCALISYLLCTTAFAVLRQSGEAPFRTFGNAGTPAKIGAAAAVVLPVLLFLLPGVNTAFGLYRISFLAYVISVLTGIFPTVVYYFVKRFLLSKQ